MIVQSAERIRMGEKMENKISLGVKWIVKNWNKIPDEFKQNLKPHSYSGKIKEIPEENHFVVLLLDRQKPSVKSCYDFDEERIGINREGKVIWGFDSGCSCPSPWVDSYPDCYNVNKTWKQFVINLKDFDRNVREECLESINDIRKYRKSKESVK